MPSAVPDDADDPALVEEDAEHRVVLRADRLEERDLLLLLEHDHDERRDDGARRDEDDEPEDEAHPDLLDEQRREEAVVELAPVHRVVDAVVEEHVDLAARWRAALSMSSTFISTPVTLSPYS